MAANFVQGSSRMDFGGSTNPITLTGVTSGNLLYAFIAWTSTTITLSSIADDKGNTWVVQDNPTTIGTLGRVAQAYAMNVASGNTQITATFSAGATSEIHVGELSGCATSSAQDAHIVNPQIGGSSPGTGTDAVTSTAITTTTNGIIVGCAFDIGVVTAPNAGTGFTSISTGTMARSEYKLISSGGTMAATFTETESFAETATCAQTFHPPAAAAWSITANGGSLAVTGTTAVLRPGSTVWLRHRK